MLAIAPERGAYYRIGACPYLSRHHDSAPVRGAEFDITMNYAPLTGAEIVKTTKRRGKPLRYNLSSLQVGCSKLDKKHTEFYMNLSL